MSGDERLDRYRAAIIENFPGLAIEKLAYLAEGWNSVACLVNDRLVFRFPKRPNAARKLALETRLLPELAPNLPLPIPKFSYISKPTSRNFPYLFVGYEALPGITQPDWPEEVWQAGWWREELGAFLTALHAFPVERAARLGVECMNFTWAYDPAPTLREALENFYSEVRDRVYPLLTDERQDTVAAFFEDFLDDDRHFEFEPVLLHADLLEDHVLVDPAAKKVSGIIDFGDVCLGDPAYDVIPQVLPYYRGKVDPTFGDRQLFYKKLDPFNSILFGLEHSDPALLEYGLNSLNDDSFYTL